MKKLCRFSIFAWAILLLPLLLAGCATSETNLAKDNHLENYRQVYFVQSGEDPRQVSPQVIAGLQEIGFVVYIVNSNRFSLPRNRPGADQPALVCSVDYVSCFNALWHQWGFQTIQIQFFDLKTSDRVYKVNHFEYNPRVSENVVLNRLFIKISDNFFPGGPNPFKDGKTQSPKA
jgi:hypothetical protein